METTPAPSGVRRLISSPRRRRRLVSVSILVGIVGAVALAVVVLPQDNGIKEVRRPSGNAGNATIVEPPPKRVKLAHGELAAARSTAAKFVATAVLRKHIDDSWELTAPELKVGFTRERWKSGEIPVVPFPAEQLQSVRWQFDYSIKDHVGLQVGMLPRPEATVKALLFEMELVKAGPPSNRRWLVDYWAPLGPGTSSPAQRVKAAITPSAAARSNRIDGAWLGLIGIFIFGTLIAIPIVLVARGKLRQVRAERAYRSSLS